MTDIKDMQRRQLVIEETPKGIMVTLRWDYETLAYREPLQWTIEQVKRTMGHTQLGREPEEINWTFNTVNGTRVWYSDVMLTLQGGIKPTDSQIKAYRRTKGHNQLGFAPKGERTRTP